MADDSDLVSQVSVEGTDAAASGLEDYGKRGAAAFEKVQDAADKASDTIGKASDQIAKAADNAAASLDAVSKSSKNVIDPSLAPALKEVNSAFERFGSSLTNVGPAVASFAKRTAVLGTALIGSAAAFATSAGKMAKAVKGQDDSQQDARNSVTELTKAQQLANTQSGNAEIQAINQKAALDKLNASFARGEISYSDYAKQLQQTKRDQAEANKVAEATRQVQERVAEENLRLAETQKKLNQQIADQKAYDDLVKKFGGPLANSLVTFGDAVNSVQEKFKNTFGPGLAKLLDAATSAITSNAGPIGDFAAKVRTEFDALATKYAPELKVAFDNLGKGAANVFSGLIASLPALINLFNNQVVPAIKAVASAFSGTADVINSVFGTKFTGGALAAILVIGQVSGAFRLLGKVTSVTINLLNGVRVALNAAGLAGGPIVLAITALTAAFIYFYKTSPQFQKFVDGVAKGFLQLVKNIGSVIASIAQFGIAIGASLVKAFSGTIQGATDAVEGIKSVFSSIGGFFTTLWAGITAGAAVVWKGISDGATAGYNLVVAAWTAAGEFFTTLWTTITAGAAIVWQTISDAATAAWQVIVAAWGAASGFFAGIWEAISASAKGLWDTITQAASDAWDAIAEVWGAVVDFFQGIWDGITNSAQAVWDALKNGFQTAVNSVKTFFSDLLATAQAKLQPIIDLLKVILSLGGSAQGAGSGQAYARGGMVRGPGTSTSDSIPAWLSNNEFVVKARAVRKYGADLLRAINEGRFNPNNIARFAAGGLVGSMSTLGSNVPRYAFAGAAGRDNSSRPGATVNLTLDGRTYRLMAPAEIADGLAAHATSKQIKSAGRRPAWES